MAAKRTPVRRKAKELANSLRSEQPDYPYLKELFREIRKELQISVPKKGKRLPLVPTEEEIRQFYQVVWQCRKFSHLVLIKTLFYTGVRVSELINTRLDDVDLERCQIQIKQGKGDKDRMVPFPVTFRELLGLHMNQMRERGATYLFESGFRRNYSDRGVRAMLSRYARQTGITHSLSPHKWRHFLFTWLKKQGIDDALIQPYSGHESRQSLEIYSRLSLATAQEVYDRAITRFPIQ